MMKPTPNAVTDRSRLTKALSEGKKVRPIITAKVA
ncbi:Uncharacterised protein [Pseudomonas aeruginosa]|nr:Uncharacterised protein [Pseudomonas aeruginosa]